MSKREVVDCDRCPATNITPIPMWLVTERSPDPAGGCSSDDNELVDLCPKCAASVIAALVKPLSYDAAANLLKDIKTMKQRFKQAKG